jgi:UDP-glucose 4-epimerase
MGLRFFNVYGRRQNPCSDYTGVISIFSKRVRQRETVTVHGDGHQIRDFVHVSDVIRHLLAGMSHLESSPGAEVVNVCTGRGTSLLQLVGYLGAMHGRAPRISHGPARLGDIRQSVGSPHAATALLNVAAHVALQDGLGSLIAETSAAAA